MMSWGYFVADCLRVTRDYYELPLQGRPTGAGMVIAHHVSSIFETYPFIIAGEEPWVVAVAYLAELSTPLLNYRASLVLRRQMHTAAFRRATTTLVMLFAIVRCLLIPALALLLHGYR